MKLQRFLYFLKFINNTIVHFRTWNEAHTQPYNTHILMLLITIHCFYLYWFEVLLLLTTYLGSVISNHVGLTILQTEVFSWFQVYDFQNPECKISRPKDFKLQTQGSILLQALAARNGWIKAVNIEIYFSCIWLCVV